MCNIHYIKHKLYYVLYIYKHVKYMYIHISSAAQGTPLLLLKLVTRFAHLPSLLQLVKRVAKFSSLFR